MKTKLLLSIASCVSLVAYSCNSTPVGSLKGPGVKVTKTQKSTDAVKVDFLWVIDNSSSMCQEQASLAQSFSQFIDSIEKYVNVDYRIAVTTTEITDSKNKGKGGNFVAETVKSFGYPCHETTPYKCLSNSSDVSCEALGTSWKCGVGVPTPKHMVNCNGSINTSCFFNCKSDQDCVDKFGEDYNCMNQADAERAACVRQPATSQCPDTEALQAQIKAQNNSDFYWLVPENAGDLFQCVATVGALSTKSARNEQGLNAALLALDRNFNYRILYSDDQTADENNHDQSRAFLRDDAYLVVVFVTDEEDCSTDDGYELSSNDQEKCSCLADSTEGGKLRSVTEVANRIKGFKTDPARVLVAAIVGDSTKENPEEREIDRALYLQSKCDYTNCEDQTRNHGTNVKAKICSSDVGLADYGLRYLQLVQQFGKNGIATNLCNAEGITPALEAIAGRIVTVLTRICLPHPIGDGETLEVYQVTKDVNGETTDKVLLTEADYNLEISPDCTGPALAFAKPLPPDAEIMIDYQACVPEAGIPCASQTQAATPQ